VSLSFDLISEPFIPCLRTDGQFVEYGLRDVLMKSHEIAEIRDTSPLVMIALHRFLLAILHRCYRGPKKVAERVAIHEAGKFDGERIVGYFNKWLDRFDLFHEKFPFYQQPGFKTAEPSGINRLAQELSRGNNAALFDHTTDHPPPTVLPAEAARLVIAEQSFAVGGGKSDTGNTTHAPLVSGAVVLVLGATLFETLWLNLTIFGLKHPVAGLENDTPVWERSPSELHKQSARPNGYLDYLTWQSRTLRLLTEKEDEKDVVRQVCYAQGRKLETAPGFYDPMIAYTRDEKEGDRPVRFNEIKDLWRDSVALFQFGETDQFKGPTTLHTLSAAELGDVLPRSAKYRLSVFGLCTDKAKVNFWRHETLPLPLAYLDYTELVEVLKLALKLAEEVGKALRAAVWATASDRLSGDSGMKSDKDRVSALVESFAPERMYWSRLELPYRELIVNLADAASPENRTVLIQSWFFDTLKPTALDAFEGTIGRLDSARDLKAVTTGRRMLHGRLKEVQKANRVPDRVPDPKPKEGVA